MADEFNEPVEETQEILPVESEPAAADIPIEKPVDEKPKKEKKVKPPKPPKAPKPPKEPKPPKTPKTPQEKARTKKIIKKTISIIVALLIVAGIAGAASWYFYFRDTSVNVTVTMVLRGEVKDLVNATGKVEANQMVPLFALQDDKVTEILVKEGDTVTSGQNILKLETGGYVTSTTAGKVLSVTVKVNDKVAGLTTPYTTQTPTTVPATTTAPATTTTTTTSGISKNPNPTVLATIANMDPTYVVANVDETDISKVKVGQKADMVLDSYPGKVIKGEVVEVGLVATVTQTGGTAFPVKIKITEAKNVDLRIGMSADTEIVVETKEDALRVPVAAVTTDSGKDAVYIVKESKAEKATIKIGLLSGEYYEVLAGITEGEEVVIKGVDLLKGEKTVKVKVKRQ